MKRWYSFYSEKVTKGQQVADQMKGDQKRHQLGAQIEVAEKGQQVADQLEMPESFGRVPYVTEGRFFRYNKRTVPLLTLEVPFWYLKFVTS